MALPARRRTPRNSLKMKVSITHTSLAQRKVTSSSPSVIPIVANYTQSEIWLKDVAILDMIVDLVGGNEIATLSETIRAAVATAVSQRPPSAGRLAFVYTSGTWVHGDDRRNTVSDATPCSQPAALISWRVDHEQRVLTERVFDGIVVRPGLIYGRSGSIIGMLFANAAQGTVKWFGTPGGRYALVHVDDLAELYVLVAERASLVAGKAIDAVNEYTESVDDLLDNLVRVSGAKGPYEYIQPSNGEQHNFASDPSSHIPVPLQPSKKLSRPRPLSGLTLGAAF
jgi:hypothetical protein